MFAEIVYETGRMSVGEYADEAELKEGLKAHNDRARNGEPGGPLGQPAERIAAVYIYDKHPDDYNSAQTMSSDVVSKELASLVKDSADDNGVVNLDQLTLQVRGLSHPMVAAEGFDSRYKAKENKKLSLAFLEGGAS